MCACMCSVNYGLIWTARVSSPHSLHIPPPQETLMVRLLILKNTMTIWLHGYTAIWLYGMTLGVTSDHTSSCIQHTSIYIKQHHHINTITISTPSPCQHHHHHHHVNTIATITILAQLTPANEYLVKNQHCNITYKCGDTHHSYCTYPQ